MPSIRDHGDYMQTTDSDEERRFETICRFVVKLGTMVHGYGPQAQRLESYLSRITRALGYSGVFHSTPTSLAFAFKRSDELWHRIHFVSMPGTGYNLAKLAAVGELVTAVEEGKVDIPEATDSLAEIDAMPPPYNNCLVALGYSLCGAGFAGFLRGSWWDIALSAILSIVVFSIVTLTRNAMERVAQWVPFLCAFVAGALAAAFNSLLPGIQAYLITLSAIIYLIPGFSISMGIIELTSKHILSGITNLTNGLICLILLFAGAWTGITLTGLLLPVINKADIAISTWLVWPFVIMLAAGLCLVFQTPRRDLLSALAGCAIAYAGMLLGERILGNNLGNFLGTALALVFANIWSGRTNRPTSIVLLPAVVFMVSGSIGFRGLVSLSAGDTALGLQEFMHMFVVAATIAIGLVVGNSLSKPRITL